MITALRVSTDDLLTEMGSSSKSQHRRDKDKSNKRERRESKKRSSKVVDQDEQEEWVEKPTAPAPAPIAVQSVPTSESYKVHANPSAPVREDWLGLGHNTTVSNSTTSNSFDPRAKGRLATEEDITDGFGQGENGSQSDFFRSFGTQGSAREEREKRREADKLAQPAVSAREINKTAFLAAQDQRPLKKPKVEFGGAGSSWRMTKLRRVYEAAEDEGRDVQQVALERYGSASAWEEALAERAFLDGASQSATQNATQVDQFGREVRPDPSAHAPQPPTNATATRLLFNQSADSDVSRPSSRQSFRRPGESPASNQPSRFNSPKPSTPIPSVTTPSIVQQRPSALSRGDSIVDEPSASTAKPVSPTTLNRLQAKVLKAKLIDPDSEETLELQKQYDLALAAHQSGASSNQQTEQVRVLPSLDGRGRLYDIGAAGSSAEAAERAQLSKRQKRKRDEQFESRDAQGNLVRYNADDDQQSLADLVRAEKFGGGSAEDKDLNKQLAGRIARDATFQNDLEYMDDMAEKLGRKKARDEDRKRMWAIQDYARTEKALDSCWFCHQEDSDPKMPVVAMGTRAYLSLPRTQGLTDAHAYIVPISHHLSSLEADEDTWDEIKNFMKTLMQMASEFDHGVVFLETANNLKSQRHTFIEAIPVPWKVYEDAPGYFRESILMAESEWSQNKRLIDFSKRPGGFRRSMVPNLPYFMVQFDYKGQEGYGHVIEGHDGVQGGEEGFDLDEAEKGGGKFERWFGAEILGNLLELEPRRWRKPKRLEPKDDAARMAQFRRAYEQFDWTKMLTSNS